MTESEWLKSKDGEAMLNAVEQRMPVEKWMNISETLGGHLSPSEMQLFMQRLLLQHGMPEDTLHRLASEQTVQFTGHGVVEWYRERILRVRPTTHLAPVLREQLGNPFRPYRCEPEWRTETVLALASAIEADRAFDRMPILADALEEAGCDERPMLDHLRGSGPHARGCWVLDLILNRDPDLFGQTPQ